MTTTQASRSRRKLVTGGAGFFRRRVCERLVAEGWEVVCLDNVLTGKRQNIGHVITVIGMKSVLDPARARGTRVFQASTSEVYGDPEINPEVETYRGAVNNFRQACSLKGAAMRYFNAAGCDPNGDLGENHDPETVAIPLEIQAALGTGLRFNIFRTDCPTQDDSAVRDYVHVPDLASTHVKAIPYLEGGGASRAFDLATGNGTSIMSLLNSVEKATGRPVPRTFRRDGQGTRLCYLPWPTPRTSCSAGRRSLLTSTTWSRRRPNVSFGSTTRQMWPECGWPSDEQGVFDER